jgi:hypothetical protein
LPAWFIPRLLDWNQHRRSRIERNAGIRESLIHALQMSEAGPITLARLFDADRGRLGAGVPALAAGA